MLVIGQNCVIPVVYFLATDQVDVKLGASLRFNSLAREQTFRIALVFSLTQGVSSTRA